MKVGQLGFTGGEFSYPMYGRPDDSAYAYGLSRARNFLIRPQGTIRSRPGFEFVTEAKYPTRKVRLIPFQFSSIDTAVIEMGHHYMRFMVNGAVVLDNDGSVYEIETPYNEADLFAIHYDQSADVMTFAHTSYSPMTLKRYGAADWRLEQLDLSIKISPPTGVIASPYYPEGSSTSGSFGYKEEDKDRVTSTYCVTALDDDGNESERSQTTSCKGNYYITGAYNTIFWNAVPGATRYKVYRESGGIYGFIGETDGVSIKDDNINADTTKTPPTYAKFFSAVGGIKLVEVLDGGSGYAENAVYYTLPETLRIPCFYGWKVLKNDSESISTEDAADLPETLDITITVQESDGSYPIPVTVQAALNKPTANRSFYAYYCNFQTQAGQASLYWMAINLEANSHRYLNPLVIASSPTVSGFTLERNAPWVYEGSDDDFVGGLLENNIKSQNQAAQNAKSVTDQMFDTGVSVTAFKKYTNQDIPATSDGETILNISDETGSGASLNAVVRDGVITGVKVTASGKDYTNPTVTATGGKGSGATFKVTLFTGEEIQAPGALGLFEQRRWFAGTNERPLIIIATKSGTTDEMSRHYPTQLVDDCIVAQAETRDANRILHLMPLQDLIMFTSSAEWRISSSEGGAITPTNISVKPQSYYGSTEIQPVIASNQCLYCTARGGHVREMGYSRDVYGYLSSDISIRATHLFDGYKINDMCYLKAPFPRLVCVSSGGFICNCTYMPEQSLQAWSSFTTDGSFESCASIPEGGDDGEDSLYVVVCRNVQGQVKRYIERMGIIENNTNEALGLDSCLIGDFATPQSVVAGLQHLEGKTVGAFCDGVSYKDLVVKDGQVSLPVAAAHIVVGLPIDYQAVTLPFITQMQAYGKGRVKAISKVYLQIIHNGALSVGVTDGMQVDVKQDFLNRYSDEVVENEIKEVACVVRGKWDEMGQMMIKHTDFAPIEITSWSADVELGG